MDNNAPKTTHLYHIGKMIRTMREFRGMTQQQLAEKANIRQATVNDIENGHSNGTINTIVAIASALNCYLDINFTPVPTND